MSRWFRMYGDVINDPKVMRLDPALRWNWVAVLCAASKNDGRVPETPDLAFLLRMKPTQVAIILAELHAGGLLDKSGDGSFVPHNWDSRQYKSDTSNERVKRHREKRRNVTRDADRNVTVARPEQKQITDISVTNVTGAPAPPIYTDSRHELWGEGTPILISLGVAEKQARSMIGSWLKSTNDDAQAVLSAIQRARDNRAHNPIPWITSALKVASNERNGSVYSHPASHQSGSTAVLAGVAAAAERRARERRAAGRERPPSGDGHVAEGANPELFGAG